MGEGYPGGAFDEKMFPDMKQEDLDKLRDDSTEEENEQFKKLLLNMIDDVYGK